MRPAVEQELVRHAAALRTLAAALVGEPAADDLVQDAAVEALRSPPVRPGPLGGWLAQIVRHLASRHRRSERRRRERERRAAHAEAVAGDHSADAPAELRATILVDGEPSASGQILLLGGNGFGDVATVQRRVDENGIFQASALPGTYRALLTVEPSGTFGSLEATDPLVIPPGGELAPTLHFVSGRARLRICDAAGDPVVGLQLEVATPNGALKTTAATDAAGGTGFRCAPGTYRVFAWPSDLQTRAARDAFRQEHSPEELDAERFELGVLDLPAGAIVERELRLPAAWRR